MTKIEFKVPIDKKSEFNSRFFSLLSDSIYNIGRENQKWPDSIKFIGPLGKELFDLISTNNWDLSKFNPECPNPFGSLNKIVIEYQNPITQITDNSITSDSSLNGKIIKGIPGPETVSKIINYSIGSDFKTEKTVRPSIHIILKRE